ncbi:MAG: hypothetical protein P8M71_04615 [Pseudomonadales bacterium]|nr:hypothetical protein [Pseudomonadales bacterium]
MKNLFLMALLSTFAVSAHSEGDDHGHGVHGGDVISEAEAGFEIHVETGEALGGEAKLFEADFQDFEGGLYATDEPGFILEDGPFGANQFLAYSMQNDLKEWDGLSWTASTNSLLTLESHDFGVQPFSLGIIGESDSEGGVHEHLEFLIDPNASAQAFLIEFILEGYSDQALSSTNGWSSESVFIVFNNGMDEASFDAGPVSAVPIPAAWLFLASGLGSLLLGRRLKAK